MPSVTFMLDYKKDAYNYWKTANKPPSYGWDFKKFLNKDIKNEIENKSWEEIKEFLYNYLKNLYKNKELEMNTKVQQFSESWQQIEKEFFKRLEKVTKHKICSERFTAYITTATRCPYNFKEKWFMLRLFDSPNKIRQVAAHEILHFQFHEYYWDACFKELGENKTDDLKEALTVLLNEDFKGLLTVEDLGYPNHQELRAYISKVWKETRDFDAVIDKCIKFYKFKIQ